MSRSTLKRTVGKLRAGVRRASTSRAEGGDCRNHGSEEGEGGAPSGLGIGDSAVARGV